MVIRNSTLGLFIVAGFVAAAALAIAFLTTTARQIVVAEAERNSLSWASYIGSEFERIAEIANGEDLTDDDKEFLAGVREFGNIFRFKLFDGDGTLQLVSDDLRTGLATATARESEHSNSAERVAETGQILSHLNDGSQKPNRPDLYTETYVPVYRDGNLVAVVELYVDVTPLNHQVRQDFIAFGSKIAFAILVGLLVPIIALLVTSRLLHEKNVKLAAAERSKSNFLAHMSHELRTPLNSVIGYAQMLETEPYGAIGHEKYREYVKIIDDQGRHLLKLVTEILDISKIDEGEVELDESEFEIGTVVENVISLLSHQRDSKSVLIHVPSDSEPIKLRADAALINQVLLNVVHNAIKFTNSGGHITVDARSTADGGCEVSVQDNGIGIPARDLQRVLEPFGQSRESIEIAHQGSGLGLFLCSRLMKLHDGALILESEVNKGTRVTLVFTPKRTISGKSADAAATTANGTRLSESEAA